HLSGRHLLALLTALSGILLSRLVILLLRTPRLLRGHGAAECKGRHGSAGEQNADERHRVSPDLECVMGGGSAPTRGRVTSEANPYRSRMFSARAASGLLACRLLARCRTEWRSDTTNARNRWRDEKSNPRVAR